jgi:hypothetical protein
MVVHVFGAAAHVPLFMCAAHSQDPTVPPLHNHGLPQYCFVRSSSSLHLYHSLLPCCLQTSAPLCMVSACAMVVVSDACVRALEQMEQVQPATALHS